MTSDSEISYRCMADIKPEPVRWLWPQVIPRGKITIIAGYPGLGKSLTSIDIASGISNGSLTGTAAKAVFICAEDDAADTIRPRLEAAKADLNNVIILDAVTEKGRKGKRCLNLQADIERLSCLLGTLGTVDLIVIDPVSAYLGKVDSHKDADVRGVLTPLAELAAHHNIAIVCISHLNKSKDGNAMMRITGSQAFVAAARAAYLVAADKDNPERRLFLPIKCNLSKMQAGLAFSVVSCWVDDNKIESQRIIWEDGTVDITANDILAEPITNDDSSALRNATIFLCATLVHGAMRATEIYKKATEAGISERTLKRAKKDLRIKSTKEDSGWEWELPKSAKDATMPREPMAGVQSDFP